VDARKQAGSLRAPLRRRYRMYVHVCNGRPYWPIAKAFSGSAVVLPGLSELARVLPEDYRSLLTWPDPAGDFRREAVIEQGLCRELTLQRVTVPLIVGADDPASPERYGARFGGVRMGSAAQRETGKPAPGLAGAPTWTRASTCTDRDLPGSPARSCAPQCRAGVRVRFSQPRVSRPCQLRPFVAQN